MLLVILSEWMDSALLTSSRPLREQRHHDRAVDGAGQAAEPAEHDGGQQPERQRQREGARAGSERDDGQQATGQAGAAGADDERQHLQPGDRQPGQRRRDLVVANGAERAADPAARDVGEEPQHDDGRGRRHITECQR